ncbi:MAG: nitrilase-related carbon-nitrogen hydrolase [Bacteroidales bacterium]
MNNNFLKMALFQTDIVWENSRKNIEKLDTVVMAFCKKKFKPDIILFPEFFSTGFTMNSAAAEEMNGISSSWLREISKKTGSAVVSSIPIKIEEGKRVNRCFFITENGEEWHYDKRHLFSIAGEDEAYTRGKEKCIVDYKGWKIALSVCYDLRFPVWLRNVKNGYDLMLNVANWPTSRIEAADILVKARAIENVSFIAFCNRTGSDNECEYNGGSLIVDSRGGNIGKKMRINGIDVIYSELDKKPLLSFRERFPSWADADEYELKNI